LQVLIGCDGSNSVVAKSLGLESPKLFPMYSVRGFTNYPTGHLYGSNGFRLREDQVSFGRIPVDDKLVYWFVGWRGTPKGDDDNSLESFKYYNSQIELFKDVLTSFSIRNARLRSS